MLNFLRFFRKRSKKKDSPISTIMRVDSGPTATALENPASPPDLTRPDVIADIAHLGFDTPGILDLGDTYNSRIFNLGLDAPGILDLAGTYNSKIFNWGLDTPGILDLAGTYNSKFFDIGVNVQSPNLITSSFNWDWERTAAVPSWRDYVNNDVSLENMFAPSSIDSIISQEEIYNDLLNDKQNTSRQYFTNRLLFLIETEFFEYGIDNNADLFVAEYMKTDPILAKEWLNSLFIENFARPSVLTKLLRIIAKIDYQDIFPEGPTMAALTLNHKDTEVQECSVRAFESWQSIKSLDILNNLKVADVWLQKYIDKVAMYLKRDFNVVPSKED